MYEIENDVAYKRSAESFFSKEENPNQEKREEILNHMENIKTVEYLRRIPAIPQYKIEYSSEHAINKLDCKLAPNAAERMALEHVVRERRVNDDDVMIKQSTLIYVPKWSS